MISVYQLKSQFQKLLRPLVNALAAKGITANQVTIAAIVLSIMAGLCIALFSGMRWPYTLLPFVLFIRMALNAIDGMLAREHHMQSKLGAILNELGDVISDTALYLPFALITSMPALVVVICILSILSEMTGVVAVQIGAGRRYDGPMGKSDRALAFGAVALLLGLGVPPGHWLTVIFIVMMLLLLVTIYNRAANALKNVP